MKRQYKLDVFDTWKTSKIQKFVEKIDRYSNVFLCAEEKEIWLNRAKEVLKERDNKGV